MIGADVDSFGDHSLCRRCPVPFIGLVAWSWRRCFDGKENTVGSQVATSVPRATEEEALDSGWEAGNRGWKCAASLEGVEVVAVLLERSNPWEDGEWEEFGDKGEV